METKRARVIWHGEWSDPEIEYTWSHYQKSIYNYYFVESLLDEQKYPDGFKNVKKRDFDKVVLEVISGIYPIGNAEPDIYFTWSNGVPFGKGDNMFTTKSQALRDGLKFSDENNYTGELCIYLRKKGQYKTVEMYDVTKGTIIKNYHFSSILENEQLD